MVQWGLGGCFGGGPLWISFMEEEEEDRLQKGRGGAGVIKMIEITGFSGCS